MTAVGTAIGEIYIVFEIPVKREYFVHATRENSKANEKLHFCISTQPRQAQVSIVTLYGAENVHLLPVERSVISRGAGV
jgi:hypothetical protein